MHPVVIGGQREVRLPGLRLFPRRVRDEREGQGGGEFYTPASIVQLLVQVIEPFHARILEPACGLSGMARFVAEHYQNPAAELAICGTEKADETGRLARQNLALHGLEATSATLCALFILLRSTLFLTGNDHV